MPTLCGARWSPFSVQRERDELGTGSERIREPLTPENSARSRQTPSSRGECWWMPGGTSPRRQRPTAGDLSGAYQLAYDALRKSAASLLEAQGLRATSRGGHIALQDAVIAQFGSSIRALRSFSRLRRARNSFEYPSTETPGPSGDDVKDAIRVAREVNDAADKILKSEVLSPW